MTPTHVNVGCGPHRAPAPWWNLDLVDNDVVHPDQVVEPDDWLPFPVHSLERIYLGHILEHVPWSDVPGFLGAVRAGLTGGGEVCIVGPDVNRTLASWHFDVVPWSLVERVLEHAEPQPDLGDWPGARHEWNCTEQRVADALTAAGFVDVRPTPIDPYALEGWPVVSFDTWQCAVIARR